MRPLLPLLVSGAGLFAGAGFVGGVGLVAGCGRSAGGPPPQVVSTVDLGRYAGTWYEIARLPTKQQEGCINTTATYAPKGEDIEVINRCVRDGKLDETKARAFLPKKEEPAKLKVEFFPIIGRGNYWILDLDPEYRWAVVGTPDRDNLWVLSRAPSLEPATLQAILGRAQQQGFATERLLYTQHDGTPDAAVAPGG